MPSANLAPDILTEKITKEVLHHRVLGPFKQPPLPNLQCSPLGLVPKKGNPGKYRMILNLSHPYGDSINSHIPQDQASVHYSSFNAALKLISKCGKGCWLAKSDLENAFRNIPMDFNSLQCLGLKLNKMFYVDMCMPFGAASACVIFETFTTFLEWAIEIKARHQLAHYLNDFFFCRKTKQECQSMLNTFTQTCQFINFPISKEKTEGPSQTLTYLGLGIDTVKIYFLIPPTNWQKLCNGSPLSPTAKK